MSFWQEPCPGRAAGLDHAHWNKCFGNAYHPGTEEYHRADQCCHCLQSSQPPAPAVIRQYPPSHGDQPPETTMPPIDVVARLRALGMVGPGHWRPEDEDLVEIAQGPEEDIDEEAPREPQMAVKEEPGHVGPAWGPGRSWENDGSLNPRDIPRLEDILYRERRRGYR